MIAKHTRTLKWASILTIAALTAACTTVTTPKGFAELPDSSDRYRAISPEGIRYEVYTRDNYPQQTLEFWNDSYEYRMSESGYTPLREAVEISTAIGPVFLHEWVLFWQREEFVYAHALGLKNESIVIVEIGGPRSIYESYRDSILAAIETLR